MNTIRVTEIQSCIIQVLVDSCLGLEILTKHTIFICYVLGIVWFYDFKIIMNSINVTNKYK